MKNIKSILLFAPALLYACVIKFRHWLFDRGWLKSEKGAIRTICIGNLEVGGTGKTPHTAFFAHLLSQEYATAILSRGYGRNTKGFRWVEESSEPAEVGDEPLTYAQGLKNVAVAVCEDRLEGVLQIARDRSQIQVVLLDDAYQHRKIIANKNLLLTRYSNLFTEDMPLPAGRLRDLPSRARHANSIVVTKCPATLSKDKLERISNQLASYTTAPVYFSYFRYKLLPEALLSTPFALVTGIAETGELTAHLDSLNLIYTHLSYKDHHAYTTADVSAIVGKLKDIKTQHILTTTKDRVKLRGVLPANIDIHIVDIEVAWHNQNENWSSWLMIDDVDHF